MLTTPAELTAKPSRMNQGTKAGAFEHFYLLGDKYTHIHTQAHKNFHLNYLKEYTFQTSLAPDLPTTVPYPARFMQSSSFM